MDHFAGLDVSVKETSVCILDDAGKIVKEMKVASASPCLPVEVHGQPHQPTPLSVSWGCEDALRDQT